MTWDQNFDFYVILFLRSLTKSTATTAKHENPMLLFEVTFLQVHFFSMIDCTKLRQISYLKNLANTTWSYQELLRLFQLVGLFSSSFFQLSVNMSFHPLVNGIHSRSLYSTATHRSSHNIYCSTKICRELKRVQLCSAFVLRYRVTSFSDISQNAASAKSWIFVSNKVRKLLTQYQLVEITLTLLMFLT